MKQLGRKQPRRPRRTAPAALVLGIGLASLAIAPLAFAKDAYRKAVLTALGRVQDELERPSSLVVDRFRDETRGRQFLTHAMLHQCLDREFGGAPEWIDEGLASYFELHLLYEWEETRARTDAEGNTVWPMRDWLARVLRGETPTADHPVQRLVVDDIDRLDGEFRAWSVPREPWWDRGSRNR